MAPHTRYIRWVPAPQNIKRIGKIHERLYRWTFGLVGGRVDGLDILLLTTTGKRSGRPRCVPLPYFRDGSRYLLVASFGGNANNPHWYANLLTNPSVELQRGGTRWNTQARVAQGAERERLWGHITYEHPRYLRYQARTTREIPVIVLDGPESG